MSSENDGKTNWNWAFHFCSHDGNYNIFYEFDSMTLAIKILRKCYKI